MRHGGPEHKTHTNTKDMRAHTRNSDHTHITHKSHNTHAHACLRPLQPIALELLVGLQQLQALGRQLRDVVLQPPLLLAALLAEVLPPLYVVASSLLPSPSGRAPNDMALCWTATGAPPRRTGWWVDLLILDTTRVDLDTSGHKCKRQDKQRANNWSRGGWGCGQNFKSIIYFLSS